MPVRRSGGSGAYSASNSTSDNGSTLAPFMRKVQCKCGPVTRPVAPAKPTAYTYNYRSPFSTNIFDRWTKYEYSPQP